VLQQTIGGPCAGGLSWQWTYYSLHWSPRRNAYNCCEKCEALWDVQWQVFWKFVILLWQFFKAAFSVVNDCVFCWNLAALVGFSDCVSIRALHRLIFARNIQPVLHLQTLSQGWLLGHFSVKLCQFGHFQHFGPWPQNLYLLFWPSLHIFEKLTEVWPNLHVLLHSGF